MTVTKTPWGEYRTLLHYGALEEQSVKVKELILKPYERTSYQRHNKRIERLIPLNSGLLVIRPHDVLRPRRFEIVSISNTEPHQLLNLTGTNLIVLEIQHGTETVESDIVRIDDPHKDVRKDY